MRYVYFSIAFFCINSYAAGFGGGPVWIHSDDADIRNDDVSNSRGYDVEYDQQSKVGNTDYGTVTATNLNNDKTYNAQGSYTNNNGQKTVNANVSNNQNSNTYQVSGTQNTGCNGSSCTKNTSVNVTNNQTGTTKSYSSTQQSNEVNVSNTQTTSTYYYPYPYYYGAGVPIMVGSPAGNIPPQSTTNYYLINSKESQPVSVESRVIFNQ